MLKYLDEVYNILKGLKDGGAKRLGCRGETSRHQIWGETTRGETTRGELVLGRNDLLPLVTGTKF